MKKAISAVLSLIMVAAFVFSFPVPVFAASASGQFSDTSREDGGTIYWSLSYSTSSGTASLSITGNGYMPNALYDDSWHNTLPSSCYLTSVTIGEGVKSIMNGAFSGESQLTYIKLPESLEIIGESAFSGTGIRNITIPSNVEKISLSMFEPTAIENINVSDNNPYFNSVDGVVYSEDGKTLVAFPVARFNDETYSFSVPETVEEIGEYAFCNSLMKDLLIPDSVKRISQFAFAGNVYLEKVSMGSNVEYIEDCAFFSCDSLDEIYLPQSLKRIEYNSVGSVYELYLEDIYAVLNDGGVSYDANDIYSLVLGLYQLDYTIDQFIGCKIDDTFIIKAPKGSTGENHANRIGVRYISTPCESTSIVKGESVYNGVIISWTEAADADGYILEKLVSGKWTELFRTTDTKVVSFKDTKAAYGLNEYRIKAYNSQGEALKIQESFSLRHYKYSIPVSAVNSASGINFTWSEGDLDKKYYIYRKAEGETSYTRIDVVSDSLSYLDTSVVNGVKYTYTVRGYDGEKLCSYDPAGVSRTYIKAPKTTVSNAQRGVLIKWEKNSKATSYSVYKKTGSGNSVLLTTRKPEESSFTDTAVKSGTTYKYYVKANIGKEKSACYTSSSQSVKFLSTPSVKAENKTNGVKLTWSKVSGASGYYVYRRTPGGKWAKIYTAKKGSIVSFTDKTAKNMKKYEYTVKAVSGKYTGSFKNPAATDLYIKSPALKSVKSTKSGVVFTYTPVSGCDGYYVYRKTGSGSWVKIATVKGAKKSSYTDKTAKKGKTYTYTVRAYDGATRSAYYSGLKIKDKY